MSGARSSRWRGVIAEVSMRCVRAARDLERLSSRAATRRASPRDLAGMRHSLDRLPDIKSGLDGLAHRDRSSELERIAQELDLLADLASELARTLVDEPPAAE